MIELAPSPVVQVVNRTGYMLLLRRHGNGCLQSLPPFQRVILSHDFGASRLAVGLPSSQYSKVKDFDLYSREEKSKLSRCLHAAFSSRSDQAAWSGEFLLSDMGAYQIQLERTENNPLLHYSVSMGIAPAPFSRTTVVEILPSYILVNETQKPLWICEAFGGLDTRYHTLDPGAVVEFHPQGKRPVAILITAVPQKGLMRRHAKANLSWDTALENTLMEGDSRQLSSRIAALPQQQQVQPLQLSSASENTSDASPKSRSVNDQRSSTAFPTKLIKVASRDPQKYPFSSQKQDLQQEVQNRAPSVSSRGSRNVSLVVPSGEFEVPVARPESKSTVQHSVSKHHSNNHSGNTWQLDDEEAAAESTTGMVWSGPVDIDSARLVQVRHPQEVRQGDYTGSGGTVPNRPVNRALHGLDRGSAFCLTEVEVCLYSGAKFVRLHDAAIPDFVLLNKTSFPLFIGQYGVPACEVVPPVPRHFLKKSYEFLGR